MKRLALLAAVVLSGFGLNAQTITIDNTNFSAGPYGAGGGISVPVQLDGCFNQANTFELYLSDAAGNFPGTLIGTYNSFYTPFVNGVIPAATAPGANYRVRVVSTNPAATATSGTFSIVATASNPITNPTTSPSNTITGNDSTFGRCLFNTASSPISLGFSVPGGTTLVGKVIDSAGNNVAATVNTTSIQFTMVQGNFYNVIATIRNADNSVSVKSYLVLASTSNLSLQTAGSNEICLPDLKEYTINTTAVGGIRNNYPGTTYTIDWGDGTTTTYTHCQLMDLNGSVTHLYTSTSCGRPAITDITPNQYNAFRVNVTAQNQFCSNSFTPISSFAKVWDRPVANFNNPIYGCINTNITFTNTSQVGLSGSNNAVNCTTNSMYEWYVDGIFVSSATNLVHSFSTTGNHTVQLVALNDPCSDDTTMIICIEPTPVPNFTMNGLNSISGCAPLTVNITNTTNANVCRPFTWAWEVIRMPSGTVATAGVHYNITPSATDPNPVIEFLEPGEYVIRLTIGNSCGTFVRERTVTLLLDADVNLPANQQYCGLRTIRFDSTAGHVVTYNVNSGTLSYNWTITPGTYTFVGGTSATSAYPQVQFNAYGTYTVQVHFTNDCGDDIATQQILFYEPTTVGAGPDQAVCFPTASVNLNGSSTGPAGYTASWSIRPGFGSGTISNPNIANPTYTFSGSDKTNGSVQLIYTATPPAGSACTAVRDTVVITIHPDNSVTSPATATICSGSNPAYTIISNVGTSTFSWTSSVISGTATGNTAAGTGANINDVLTNTSATTNAVVRYVITPAANGCNGNVFNLDVTVKPIPDFTLTPSATTLCSGQQLTINLASGLAGAQYTWTSTPAGGTVTGNTNQASPTATTSIVNTINNTGTTDVTLTYTIIVYNTGTPVCTGESEQVIVTIRPPVNATAGSNSPVCTGQTINLTGNSTNAGATFSWTGPNGFASSSQSPAITNAIPAHAGVYTLVATAAGCPSPGATTTVVVNPAPAIGTVTGSNPTTCASATGSISVNGLENSTTYTVNYTFNGTPAAPVSLTTNGSGSLVIPNLVAGIYDNITVSLSGCASNAAGPVTLSDPSAPNTPTAGSNSPICSGNTLTLNASTSSPGVASYTWSGPNGFTSTQQNPSILNAPAAATGTYNVTVTINNCTSAAGSVSVVVNQTPVLPTAGSNSPVCTGGTLNLTANTSTGGSTYAWTGPNGFTSALQNPSIAAVTAAEAGTYSVIATLGSCSSAAGTTNVVINPTPVIAGTSSTNPTACASATGSITLNGLANNTAYSVSYTRDGNPVGPVTITSNGTGSLVIPNLVAGVYNNIQVTLSGCPSNVMGPITLVDPSAPATPTAASNAPICSGNTLNLTASTTSPGTATYAWIGPNGFSSAVQNPSITNVTTAASGTYSVTVTIAGCTSGAGTTDVVINPTPATPVAVSNSPVCSGNDLNLSATSATAGVSWSWTGPNGFNSNQQNPVINNATTAATGTYNVTATLGSCTSAAGTVNVIVHPTPVIGGSSASNPTNCASSTGSISLTGLTASTTYTVNYTQGATPVTTSLMTDASGNLVIPNLPAGSYSNIAVSLNNCPSNVVGPFTLSDPNPPATPVAVSNGPVCSGNTLNLSATTSTAGTASWNWSGPAGFNSTLQNPSITNVATTASGTYTVTVTINSCTSAAGTVNVVVNQSPATPVVSSNSPACSGTTLNLGASTTTPGTITWAWSGPNGFSSIVQNPNIPNVTVAAAGTYTVTATATTGSCPSAAANTVVVVNPTPVITTTSFTDPTNCQTSTGSITLNGLAASTSYSVLYDFNAVPQTATLSSNASGALVIPNLVAGTYSNIRVVLTGCPSNSVGPVTLTDPNPPATPVAVSNGPVCSGNTLQLSATTTSAGAITYTWSGPNGFTSAQQNPSIAGVTMAANGTYSVTATLNGCTSSAGTVAVVVNETPATPVAGNNSPICSDSTLQLTATTSFAGAVSWSWTGPNGFASSSQNPSIVAATTAANGVYNVIATATTGSCPSAAGSTTVTVNQTPVISSTAFTNPTACLSSTGSISLNGLGASTAYTVSYTQNGNPVTATITSNASGVISITNLPAGVYNDIRVATLSGCRSLAAGPFTLTDPNPPAAPTAGSNSPICTGETLQLTSNTTTPGAIVYTWTGPAGFSSNLQNPSILNASPANSGTYFVTATLNNCASPQVSVTVEVTTLPAAPAVTTPVNYCINTAAVALTATPAPGNSLRWYTTATGGTGSATAPVPSTAVAGVTAYYVSQVTALGCEGSRAMIEVVVNPDALAAFTYAPMTNCAPFNINTSVIQPVLYPTRNSVYEWYANGVLIGTGTSFPGYTINNPGDSILIKLKTLSPFGCLSDSTDQWFYTFPRPVTNFTASDTVGCGPLTVTFTNTTPLMGQFSYIWNFGNGVTSNLANPGPVVFAANPTTGDTIYQVSLTAFTQCDTIVKTIGIRVKSKPQAIISPDKTYGCSPLTVVFNNISLGANMTFQWNFGDGSPTFVTTNTLPVQHTYNTGQQDTFYVRLIATNECGSDTGFYNIVVAARTIDLDVAVNGNEKTGCAPHTVRFYNNCTGATNFVWDFGDGNLRSTTSNIDTVVHTYLTVGTFNVLIKASNGCTDTTVTETISVFAKPLVNFTVAPTSVCVGDTLQFTNQSDTLTGLLWNFDDGVTSQLTNPVHAYSTPGTYNVKLIGIRQYAPGNACTDSITRQITVVASLPGNFRMSDSVSTCVPFTVTFTNLSLPSALTTWDFGDGGVDTGDVVTHTFNQGGVYNVAMTARDLNGCAYNAGKQVTVNGPSGNFFYDNGYICGNAPVRFEAITSGTDSIRWDFGDGTFLSSTANIVYHVYTQPGVYVPSIRLLSGPGAACSRLVPGSDTIRVEYISAGFTTSQVRGCGSTAVSFTDSTRSFFGLQSWQWNFGDGNSSTLRNPVHVYSTTNTWPIRLIATSASGCADTTDLSLFVKVDVKPEASIVHDPTGCVNQPVTYTSVVVSSDAVNYYSWTFSNLATGNTATVLNNYAAPGVYTAQLIAGTTFGCYDTATSTITINPSPFVRTDPDMVICRGESAHLMATGALNYTWAPFTGLSCNACPNPVASPLTTTQYVVTGYNSFGCASRDTILITVPQPITVDASADMVMCIGQSRQLIANGATTYQWSPAATLSAANIPNPVATPTTTTVYRVIGFDAYSCFQDTAFVTVGVGNYPVVNIGRDTVVATGTLLNLAPTVTNGPITLWSWTPTNDLSCTNCPAPIATAKKDICYNVTATNAFGCSGKDTICIRVFCESAQVFIPNAFTPDGDGINDVLTVRASGVKLVKTFRIFNRWGQLVFEKSAFPPNADSHGWDGKVKGVAAPPDVYVYTCEVVCEDDTPYTYKGNVAILK